MAMERVGALVGMAFQIQDDILDVTGDARELGKPVFSDEKNHKVTYVTLHGLEEARAEVARLSDKAMAALDVLPRQNPFLRELIASLVTRRK